MNPKQPIYSARWNAKNADKVREYDRAWSEANREKKRAAFRRWYYANRERAIQRVLEWRNQKAEASKFGKKLSLNTASAVYSCCAGGNA